MVFYNAAGINQFANFSTHLNTLHIDSVTKSYGHKNVLSDIFLTCKKGEILGLIGRNGSGKSTLLKIVFGTEKPDTKFVKAGNKIINTVSDGRNLINYLPQDNFLPNGISIKKIINLFLEAEDREVVMQNKHILPILKKRNEHLSVGEKRIIEILLIIHSKADFILLDEPFNGVSPIMRNYIVKYIKKLESKKGFIITDHDYENVLKLTKKVSFLQNGYLRQINDIKDLVELGYMTETNLSHLSK